MFHGSKMQTDVVCMDGRINRSILSVNHIISINQSIHQPINQPTNQATNQTYHHIYQSIYLRVCELSTTSSGTLALVGLKLSAVPAHCNLVKLAGEGMTGPHASFCNFAMTSVAAS
jgi:hypothetical protein